MALPGAVATRRGDPVRIPADAVAVEIRGAGSATRQVNNFMSPAYPPAGWLGADATLRRPVLVARRTSGCKACRMVSRLYPVTRCRSIGRQPFA